MPHVLVWAVLPLTPSAAEKAVNDFLVVYPDGAVTVGRLSGADESGKFGSIRALPLPLQGASPGSYQAPLMEA